MIDPVRRLSISAWVVCVSSFAAAVACALIECWVNPDPDPHSWGSMAGVFAFVTIVCGIAGGVLTEYAADRARVRKREIEELLKP